MFGSLDVVSMPMTIIERVARALCETHTGAMFDAKSPVIQRCFLEDARAAIAAMPVPTSTMMEAMIRKASDRGASIGMEDAHLLYQAAIDAAAGED
jgi:hypothetical protein